MTTDVNGNVLARQSYYPYGSVRPGGVGTLPTDITFTGQRADATGLMYYRARYYDSLLGRFVSADTIVPEAGNPQNLNRFAYVNSNPLRYADPTGHLSCSSSNVAEGDCTDLSTIEHLRNLGIHFDGDFPLNHLLAFLQALRDVGAKFARDRVKNETVFEALQAVFGLDSRPLHILHVNSSNQFVDDGSGFQSDGAPRGCQITSGACTVGKSRLALDGSPVYLVKSVTMSLNPLSARNNAVHELGHLFGSQVSGYSEIGAAIGQDPKIYGRPDTTQDHGFASAGFPWQQATHNVGYPSEVFADQFLGWTYSTWSAGDTRSIGEARSNWMTVNMTDWLTP